MILGQMQAGQNALNGLNVFKPVQYILLSGRVQTKFSYENNLFANDIYEVLKCIRANINHTNSATAYTRQLVPSMDLLSLMQICTIEEGFAYINPLLSSGARVYDIEFQLPIKLSPDGGVALNNNSYLSCDFDVKLGDAVTSVVDFRVNGIESKTVNSNRVMLYTRYFIPQGELQRQFDFTTQKAVYIHHSNTALDSILMPCVNGATPIFLPDELKVISRLQNDLVAVGSDVYTPVAMSTGEKHNIFLNFGGSTLTKIVLVDPSLTRQVRSMTVKTDGSKSYTFFTADFYDINSGTVVANIK